MQKIRIDFDNPGLPQHISAVENDSQSRFFQATLYENGKAYTAPEGAAYSIMYRGFGPQNQGWYDTINDGAGKRAACAVSGNVVTCEIARQALQVPGHVSIVLCVTTGKGYMLKSWPIECDCKNDRYDSTAEIESFFYVTSVSNASWMQVIQAVEELKNIIDPTLSLSGKAADAAKVGEEQGFDTLFTKQTSGGSLFDYCQTIGQACDLGFRIVLDGTGSSKRLLFECFRPAFDPNHRYSPQWGNLLNTSWAFADTNYANVALVQGAGEGAARATVWVGNTAATGAARREMYIDARDIQPDTEKDETTASQSYLEKLADRGGTKLLAQLRTGSIEFDVDDDSLCVGDVLQVSLPQLGYTAMVRVADIITQSQESGTTRTIRLGTPAWNKL